MMLGFFLVRANADLNDAADTVGRKEAVYEVNQVRCFLTVRNFLELFSLMKECN